MDVIDTFFVITVDTYFRPFDENALKHFFAPENFQPIANNYQIFSSSNIFGPFVNYRVAVDIMMEVLPRLFEPNIEVEGPCTLRLYEIFFTGTHWEILDEKLSSTLELLNDT